MTFPALLPPLNIIDLPDTVISPLDRVRKDQRLRFQQSLYFLATTGISLAQELCEIATNTLKLNPQNQSMAQIFRHGLSHYGLTVAETHPYLGPSNLILIRLSALGREICEHFSWSPVESEWEKLIRAHSGLTFPKHTVGLLATAYHARRRGWMVTLLPEITTSVEPDLVISHSAVGYFYVEFETRARGRTAKWLATYKTHGYVGVVTFSAAVRRALVQECKVLRLPVMATDLQTLSTQAKSSPFWVEQWGTFPQTVPNRASPSM